jgi:metal-responsive CopG/Arc/MetJ family transcriptional regulator
MVSRPRPIDYPNLIQVRMSDALLAEVDAYAERAEQSRSESLRQLVTMGLNVATDPEHRAEHR